MMIAMITMMMMMMTTMCACCGMQSLFAAVVFFSFTVKYGWFLTLWALGSCSFNVLVTRVLMKRIPAAAFAWRRTEGDLRFAHARVREYSESVAFYDGQLEERHNVDDMFSKATAAFRAMLLAQLPPSLFAQVYTTMSGTVAFGGIAVSMFYLDGFKSGSYTQAFEALGRCPTHAVWMQWPLQ
jgi:ABC-type uncharacterized transport system fused permease/ATPase subunit